MDPSLDEPRLQLVFSGECLSGHDPQAVRVAVAKALKLDERRAARLFSGSRIVLRRELDVATAHRAIARFAMIGALVRAEPSKPRRPRPASTEPAAARGVRALLALDLWAWWQTVGIGALCIAGGLMLGVLLGPGWNALWPDPSPPEEAMAAPQAPADKPPAEPLVPVAADAPLAMPPSEALPAFATTGPARAAAPTPAEEILQEMSPEAEREYKRHYLRARTHKAFAISSGGVHAWQAGAPTDVEARELALARCVAALRLPDDGCRIIDADGKLLE